MGMILKLKLQERFINVQSFNLSKGFRSTLSPKRNHFILVVFVMVHQPKKRPISQS